MVETELRIAGVPAVAVAEGSPEEAARRGTVLVLHGLGGHKGVHRPELTLLARHGLLALGLDAVGHGARRWADFEARFAGDASAASFAEVVRQSVAEIPALVDELVRRRWAVPGRLGVAGTSMGGYQAYGIGVTERRIGAALAVAASPEVELPGGSPRAHPERFFPLALLSAIATADEVVPPAATRALHAALEPHYAAAPERLRLIEVEGASHMLPEEAWRRIWDEGVRWFERFLG